MSYQGLGEESYSSFNARFYKRIGDGTMFDCGDINLLKVVLDGLKVNYVSRGRYRNRLLSGAFSDKVIRILKHKRAGDIKLSAGKGKVLAGLSGRKAENQSGKPVPVYFERLFREFGRDAFYYVAEGGKENIETLKADLSFTALVAACADLPLTGKQKQLRSDLIAWYARLKEMRVFDETECENIGYGLDKFFREKCAWDFLLEETAPSSVLITCHYHNEGLIAAARDRKIKVTELQHGLISPEDIFFIFPEQVRGIIQRALFPDEILVYGEFWKQRLSQGAEATSEKISVGGYYQFDVPLVGLPEEIKRFINHRKVILLCTQYSMEGDYRNFAEKLKAMISSDWCILLKPHPHEKKELYASLEDQALKIVSTSLGALMTIAAAQVSVFSTTLFDALRYNVINFALDLPQYHDYVESMVGAGIAYRLLPEENILDKIKTSQPQQTGQQPGWFYAKFDRDEFARHVPGLKTEHG